MVANSSGKKIDVSKIGVNAVKNDVVRLNLQGQSKTMKDKNWVDPQGRKGKVGAGRWWLFDGSVSE